MTVGTILNAKGRDVLTVRPTQTLRDAILMLSQHGIGAILVTGGDQALLGILSERDIVRALAQGTGDILSESVSAHMTSKVVTCTQTTSLAKVMELMTAGKFRHVPVVEAGALVGIISIGDVVKKRLADIEAEHSALRHYIASA